MAEILRTENSINNKATLSLEAVERSLYIVSTFFLFCISFDGCIEVCTA